MILLPAIDIKDGTCVRLQKGDYQTAHKVAENPLETALSFQKAGAEWIHMVDLDGAKDAVMVNQKIFLEIAQKTNLRVELGGGIRNMETVDYYLQNGISRVILGSAAVKNPRFVERAVGKYRDQIAVGIDARNEMVAAEGWLDTSNVHYLDLAKKMEQIGVKTIIFTDIAKDGMLQGPNVEQLRQLNAAVSCNIIASGGVSTIEDIRRLRDERLYGAICGKALYTGGIDLQKAIFLVKGNAFTDKYFQKSELLPAIIQEASTGQVLMLAYMNRESMQLTLDTGYTWFYSRSRKELWNKGATSGHLQKVVAVFGDCDDDTLLVQVEQTGPACHTGAHSCFFNEIIVTGGTGHAVK